MRIVRVSVLVCVALVCVSCSSCKGPLWGGESGITILSYNVENLFDDVDNGTEYREFDPGYGSWGTNEYHAKLAAVAEVLKASVEGGPDIVALQEVENSNALKALADSYAKELSYRYTVMVEAENAAVNTGILSRYPAYDVKAHRISSGALDLGRYVVEARFLIDGVPLVVFNNHWKSKIGSEEETEILRIAAASLLCDRISSLLASEPDLDIVVLGDLNESERDFPDSGASYHTALVPLESEPEGGVDWPCILVASDQILASVRKGRVVLYSPWKESGEAGSYLYKDQWLAIDHALSTPTLFDGEGFTFQGFSVFKAPFLLDADGSPRSYVRGSGYSDHLPILLSLSVEEAK